MARRVRPCWIFRLPGIAPMLRLTSAAIFCGLLLASAHAQQIGVAACDDYMAKYEACLKKQGIADQARLDQALGQVRTSWKMLADNPQMKPSLEGICKQTAEAAKAEFGKPPHNCAF